MSEIFTHAGVIFFKGFFVLFISRRVLELVCPPGESFDVEIEKLKAKFYPDLVVKRLLKRTDYGKH